MARTTAFGQLADLGRLQSVQETVELELCLRELRLAIIEGD